MPDEQKQQWNAKDAKRGRGRGGRGKGGGRMPREEKEFDQRILDLARVTRVMKGGKRLSFRATVMVGDRKGRVGLGVGKAQDVSQAIAKATRYGEKGLIRVPMIRQTIPHRVDVKYGSARLMIKPAPRGTGIRAGGVVRVALELGGVPNAVSKIFGSKNKINNARAVLIALQSFKEVRKGKQE